MPASDTNTSPSRKSRWRNGENISRSMPFLAPYRATKGAMAALTETLRSELAPFNIHLKEIFPGPVATSLSGGRHSPSYARCSQSPALRAYGGASEGKPEVGQSHILDPDGAMRDGTCAMSRQGLENWRPGRGGEPLIAGVVQSMLDGPQWGSSGLSQFNPASRRKIQTPA